MRVYRISHCKFINDLTGTGAALYGGRWNSKAVYILYTAASPSLALLESLAHIKNVVSQNFCMICLDIPEEHVIAIQPDDLPAQWRAFPAPDTLKKLGDNFIKDGRYLALKLPSAIMPEEQNYLLNPAHKDFKKIKIVFSRKIVLDTRVVG